MHYPVFKNDDFYENLIQALNSKVPEFKSVFDDDDGVYPVLGEFGRFLIEQINDNSIRAHAQNFINAALMQGGSQTEDAIVIQVYQQLYLQEDDIIVKFKSGLNDIALSTFEKYLQKFNDSNSSEEQ